MGAGSRGLTKKEDLVKGTRDDGIGLMVGFWRNKREPGRAVRR